MPAESNFRWNPLIGLAVLVVLAVLALVASAQGFLEVSLSGFTVQQLVSLLTIVVFTAAVIERAVEVYVNRGFGPKKVELDLPVSIAEQGVTIHDDSLTREMKRQVDSGTSDPKQIESGRKKLAEAQETLRRNLEASARLQTKHRNRTAPQATALALVLSFVAAGAGVRLLGQFLHLEGSTLGNALENCQDLAREISKVEDVVSGVTGQANSAVKRLAGIAGNGQVAAAELDAATSSLKEAVAKMESAASAFAAEPQSKCEQVDLQIRIFRAFDMLLTTLLLAGGAEGIHRITKRFLPSVRS